MYAREIDGVEHTFGVSGKLIMNALVMYDHQTRTLWSQFLGQGVKGSLAGTELEFVPVTHTRWSAWRDAHPDTLVLDKQGRYQRDSYEFYYRGTSAGVIGETRSDNRLHRKALVVGVEVERQTKAYPFTLLMDESVVNDSVGGQDIVVFMEQDTDTALVYNRRVDGRSLTFRQMSDLDGLQALLEDEETGSKWQAFSGLAVEGPLKGERLERAPSHLSFWFAWKDWNPDTDIYEAVAGT